MTSAARWVLASVPLLLLGGCSSLSAAASSLATTGPSLLMNTNIDDSAPLCGYFLSSLITKYNHTHIS
jgi:hypothetical protein